ncbi:MAG TPA: phytanoyl-CoA dioxygenase family protein [Candidatus Sericytochromatia bacterium]
MISLNQKTGLCSLGYELDCHPNAFGHLKNSSDLYQVSLKDTTPLQANDTSKLNLQSLEIFDELRRRMLEDGYLYLPGLLNPQAIWRARLEIAESLAAEGSLASDYSIMDCVARSGLSMSFRPDLALKSPTLKQLLYSGTLMEFFQGFLAGNVRPYDYTWLRAVAPGWGTYPHCDIVYMGRGTHNLYTVWTPLGDISWDMGGLMILENSHRLENIKNRYGLRDVDSYCENRKNAQLYASNQKWWDGALSKNPVSLRQRYGGRWLSNEFKAGDVLIFSMFTIHASLDNHSQFIRLSSDSRYQLASEPVDERWIGIHPIGHSTAAKRGRLC